MGFSLLPGGVGRLPINCRIKSGTRQNARWRELSGPAYRELGHRDTIDWHHPSGFIETFRRAFGATPGKFYTGTGPLS